MWFLLSGVWVATHFDRRFTEAWIYELDLKAADKMSAQLVGGSSFTLGHPLGASAVNQRTSDSLRQLGCDVAVVQTYRKLQPLYRVTCIQRQSHF